MKKSLFKRVSASAVAVPLALTQCFAFTAGAANDEAATTTSDAAITLTDVLYIEPSETVSEWNLLAYSVMQEAVGKKGTIPAEKFIDFVCSKAKSYEEALRAAIELYVVKDNDVTYEVTADGDLVFTATLTQPNFNGNYEHTPGKMFTKLANEFNAPELLQIDFSSVPVDGIMTVKLGTSALAEGKTVVASVQYETSEGDTLYGTQIIDWTKKKVNALKEVALEAIKKAIPAIADSEEAIAKFNADFKEIENKIDKAQDYYESALRKDVSYKTLSDAITAANEFAASKGINRKLPLTATEIAANNKVDKYTDKGVDKGNSILTETQVDVDAATIGAFVDSLTSIDDTVYNISVTGGIGTLVGAFEDAEADDVKDYVESLGYAYVSSYKKLTATFDPSKRDTADTASLNVEIERILVTETTTTSTATTSTVTTTSTNVDDPSKTTTSTNADDPSKTTTSTDVPGSGVTTTSTGDPGSSVTTTSTDVPGSGDTTTSTIPEGAVTTTAVKTVYVEIEEQPGFYLNVEDSFDEGQIKSAYLNIVYAWGYDLEDGTHIDYTEFKEVKDITSSVGFGTATPENTYDPENKTFVYNVNVVYAGEDIKDGNGDQILTNGNILMSSTGKNATVEAFIGVKGDATLDNIVDANDASAVLTYYAKTSTEEFDADNTMLSTSELVSSPSSIYDDFAAFLSDVKIELNTNDKFSRFAKKSDRLLDAIDATAILTFYANGSTEEYNDMYKNDPSKLWDIVLG